MKKWQKNMFNRYIYIHNSDTNMNIMYVHCGYNVYIMCIYDEK